MEFSRRILSIITLHRICYNLPPGESSEIRMRLPGDALHYISYYGLYVTIPVVLVVRVKSLRSELNVFEYYSIRYRVTLENWASALWMAFVGYPYIHPPPKLLYPKAIGLDLKMASKSVWQIYLGTARCWESDCDSLCTRTNYYMLLPVVLHMVVPLYLKMQ